MSLEKKIATNLFHEYHKRIGRLHSYMNRTKGSRHLTESIIAYGVMCLEIGRNLELDHLKAFLAKREADRMDELNQPTKDALQSSEDEHGIEQHQKQQRHLTS